MRILTKVGWIGVLVEEFSIRDTSADTWYFEMKISFARAEAVHLAAAAVPNWVVQFDNKYGSEKIFVDKVSRRGSQEEKVARVLMDTPEGVPIIIKSMTFDDSYTEVGPSPVAGQPRYFRGRQIESIVKIEGIIS